MQCASCGGETPPEAKFCALCGARLAAVKRGRYQPLRVLGSGAAKRVHLARDVEAGREVALALYRSEAVDPERVRREAQALQRLGSHPNVVGVLDAGEEDGTAFLVSEYVAGGDLTAAVNGGLPWRRGVEIAIDLCRALEHAHAHGVVHRDIKPANVWLTDEGMARLGDFGLAAASGQARLSLDGSVVGTALYMAPEQALGGHADARSDLYSLGALLYELLTGRPPFEGDDAAAVIAQHVNAEAVAPRLRVGDLPPALDSLVRELLAKAPDERPQHATAVRERLERVLAGEAEEPERRATPASRTPFVGRADELALLKRRLDAAVAGAGGLVLVGGEPGIGKTRLTEEAAVYASLRGARVLVGRCFEEEAAPAFSPWIEVLGTLPGVDPTAPDAAALSQLLPELRVDGASVPALAPEQERRRLFESIASLLVRAAAGQPLLVVLDDLHWADAGSLALVQHLARRLPASAILLLGTYRDVELDRSHPLSAALADLRRERLYERVLLRGLRLEDVSDMLARTAGHDLDAAGLALAEALEQETEGNPFFIEEIVRHLAETGAIYMRDGRWVSDATHVDDLGLPEGVREVIGRRLSRLSDACNDVLRHAAVLGREFEHTVLMAMTGHDEDAVLGALEEALLAQLVRESGDVRRPLYGFSHALVRETLLGELSLARRQRLHVRAADAIERVHARDLERHVAAIASHLRAAGAAADVDRALDYALRAGDAAASVFAWEEAAAHWEGAVELLEGDPARDDERARLLERLGAVLYLSSADLDRGLAALEEALEVHQRAGRRHRAAELHGRIGIHLCTYPARMDIDRALEHFQAGAAILEEEGDSVALGLLHGGIASAQIYALRKDEGLAAAVRAREIAERLDQHALRTNARALEIYCRWMRDEPGAVEELEEVWQEADRANEPFPAYLAAWELTVIRNMRGQFDAAIGAAERELARPRLDSSPVQRQVLLAGMGYALVYKGEVERSRNLDAAAAGVWGTLGASIELYAGDPEKGLARCLEGAARDASSGNRWFEGGWLQMAGMIELWLDRYAEAADTFQRSAERLEPSPAASRGWTLAFLTRAQALGGRTDDARATLATLEALLERDGALSALAAYARAALAAAEGRFADAFSAADAALADLPDVWTPVHVLRDRARVRRSLGEPAQALADLDDALERLRRNGAGRHLIEPLLREKLEIQGATGAAVHSSIGQVAESIGSGSAPQVEAAASAEGAVTLVFSDIEDSTILCEQLGDEPWLEILRAHNEIVRGELARHEGTEIKAQGDGFMLAFPSPAAAAAFAVAVQQAMDAQPLEAAGLRLRVRIGMHTGRVIRERDDLFGRNVNLAARIADAARGGEILASDAVRSAVAARFGPPRELALKGFNAPQRVHSLEWAA